MTSTGPRSGFASVEGVEPAATHDAGRPEDSTLAREAATALAALGPSSTAPRRAILEVMLGSSRLQTPEELLGEVRRLAPSTSLATVYRTLERLEAAGRLKRATLASGAVGYGYCATGHHEHAICLRCGRLEPIRPCLVADQPALPGMRVESHVLDLYGICERCSLAAGEAADDPAGAAAGDAAGSS
jgi:Fe2+ or Zn2+ uptake regulation protein